MKMKMKIETGDLPFIKAPNWTPIHKLKNHTDTTLNPFFKLDPMLYKLKTPHTKNALHTCLNVSSKFHQNAPHVCQNTNKKNTKKLGIGKTQHLKINIVKDLLTSKHSMTQKLAL